LLQQLSPLGHHISVYALVDPSLLQELLTALVSQEILHGILFGKIINKVQ